MKFVSLWLEVLAGAVALGLLAVFPTMWVWNAVTDYEKLMKIRDLAYKHCPPNGPKNPYHNPFPVSRETCEQINIQYDYAKGHYAGKYEFATEILDILNG